MKFLTALLTLASCFLIVAFCLTKNVPHNQAIIDVSWPNCHALITADQGIVGVTGGLDFRPNPCVRIESTWFTQLALYMNTGYPGDASSKHFPNSPRECAAHDTGCLAYNYGYNAAVYAIDYANYQGVIARRWWLDVETENSWSANPLVNRESIRGAISAIDDHAFMPIIGIYSYPGQWQDLTANWQNYLPNWVATGSRSQAVAIKYCSRKEFTGGPTRLTQYTKVFDENYACTPVSVSRL